VRDLVRCWKPRNFGEGYLITHTFYYSREWVGRCCSAPISTVKSRQYAGER
jgi:hypothetical protein